MPEANLTFLDAQNIIGVKIFLAIFLVFCLVSVMSKKINSWQFLLGSGFLMGAGYYFLVKNLQLPFWGLKGDELTIAAIYSAFSHISFFSDFSYYNLPPFYPPLFFWVTVAIGKLLSLSAVGMAKLGAFLTFTFFPIIFYTVQKLYWRNNDKIKNLEVALLTSPLLMMLFVSVDEIFGKPYELLAAAGALYWLLFLYLEIKKPNFSFTEIMIFGIAGSIIFMTYYLWLVFAVIALAILGLTIKKEEQWKFFSRSGSILFVSLLFSAPYLLPLIISYAKHGTENWQASFFTIENVNWRTLFFEKFDWKNLLMFFGFASIVYNYRDDKIKPLIAALTAAYLWWFMGLVTLTFFQVPMQEFRGFYYFMPVTLAIGLSFCLAKVWTFLDGQKSGKQIKIVLMISGLLIFATYSILGSFIDDPLASVRIARSRSAGERFIKLANYLTSQPKIITLNSIPELAAFVPINNFIYFNQQNSHPAANFSERLLYVKEMALAKNDQEFYYKIQRTPFGKIGRFILYRSGNSYPLFFHTDKVMAGIEENIVYLPVNLLSNKYFKLAYKYYDYEIWETR